MEGGGEGVFEECSEVAGEIEGEFDLEEPLLKSPSFPTANKLETREKWEAFMLDITTEP